ncbi:MAG: c-type cytochrome, partial [Gemmataceae bacterium]
GWEQWEMIHRVEKGGNYGWSLVESRQPVNTADQPGPTPVRPPIIELSHSDAASITGGYVYRGKKFPDLYGKYIFGDWDTRRIWAATLKNGELDSLEDLVAPTVRVIGFAEDAAGEIYYLDYDSGTVHTLDKKSSESYDPAQFPKTLSATGLYSQVASHTLAAGVQPYSLSAHQWDDYGISEHFAAFPGESAATHHEQKKMLPGNVNWHFFSIHFPKNAVLGKTISLDMTVNDPKTRRRVETQLLHFDGENWSAYTYAWRADGSDADLVPKDGAEKDLQVVDPAFENGIRRQRWNYASRAQCFQCHNFWSEFALGFQLDQLNREIPTPSGSQNQLTYLGEMGLLHRMATGDKPMPPYTAEECGKKPKLIAGESLENQARGYLHANCAHCHRFGAGGSVNLELHTSANLKDRAIGVKPARGDFRLPDAKIIAPGEPTKSVLYYRMAKFGAGRMPHIGSELVDPRGTKLIYDWITAMKPDVKAPEASLDTECGSVASAAQYRMHPKPEFLALAKAQREREPIRDMFEGYFDPGAIRKLGTHPKPKSILSLAGNPVQGEALFQRTALQCATCHQVDGKGGAIGPDLSGIGKLRTRGQLLESLLEPSRRIDAQYQMLAIQRVDGMQVTGIVVKKSDTELVLRDAKGTDHRMATAEIETQKVLAQSIMPEGLLRDLSAQDAADLLAYLEQRKTTK